METMPAVKLTTIQTRHTAISAIAPMPSQSFARAKASYLTYRANTGTETTRITAKKDRDCHSRGATQPSNAATRQIDNNNSIFTLVYEAHCSATFIDE